MNRVPFLRWVIFTLAVLSHLLAGAQFGLELPRSDVPQSWVGDFFFLLCLSLLISVRVAFTKRQRARVAFLAVQLGLLVLMGIPEGQSLGIEANLGILMLLESALLLGTATGYVFSALVVIIIVAVQTVPMSFLLPIARPTWPSLIGFGGLLTLVYGLTSGLSTLSKRVQRQDELLGRLDESIARLINANVGIQRYAKEVEGESISGERKRVSREIHDTIGYTVTSLIMLMEAASDLAEGNEELKALLKQGIDQSIFSLDEIRRSLRDLRAMDVPQRHGLRAIKKMIQAFAEATRVQVSVDFTNVVWNFGDEADEVFYRMIQESLANAFRHGGATKVSVIFGQTDHDVHVTIWDNGRGSAEIHEGIGLSGMRERIERLNGRLFAQSVVDGFKLDAVVPVADTESANER